MASKGHLTFCVGRSKEKVEKICQGFPIIYEESLEEMLKDVLDAGKLKPTTDLERAILNSDLSFICVGTPSKTDGSIDLSQIQEVSKKTGQALAKKIRKIMGSKSKITSRPLPKDDPRRRLPEISKAKELLRWQSRTSLEEGLKRTIARVCNVGGVNNNLICLDRNEKLRR